MQRQPAPCLRPVHSGHRRVSGLVLGLSLAATALPAAADSVRACEAADYTPTQGHCARLPGVELFYHDSGPISGGNGQTVVFLHAASGNADTFKHNLAAFQAAGYRTVAYDRRNVGRSSNTIRDDSLGRGYGTLVGDLHDLTQHLKLERFHLVSVAAGAQVAAQYAARYPDRVQNVVYAATLGPIGLPAGEPSFAQLRADIALPFEVFCPMTLDTPVPAPLRLSQNRLDGKTQIPAVTREHQELGSWFRATDRAGVADFLAIEAQSRHREAEGCPRALVGKNQPGLAADDPRNPNTFAKITQLLTGRALLLAGTGDVYYSPPVLMHAWGRHLPQAFYTQMDTGHAPQFEQPAQFNDIVLRFLAGDESFARLSVQR